MQHLPIIDVERRGLRAEVCPMCYQRPPGSEKLPATVARPCEGECTLFLFADKLTTLAARAQAEGGDVDWDRLIRDEICNKICHRPTAGDYCLERLNATCPMYRHAAQAAAVLLPLARARNEEAQQDRGRRCG
jgi:hypothetical protein